MTIYANKGASFEGLVEYANAQYANKGIAIITKQHTLCKAIRNSDGKIISAKYEEKATVDYMGRYGDRPVAFEVKHCSEDSIDLKRVMPHQCDFLREWTAQEAAIGFVLVSFRFAAFYLIPWPYWQAAIEARATKTPGPILRRPLKTTWQTTGKASVKKGDLPPEWEVTSSVDTALDYIATIDRLWGTQA